MGAGSTGSNTQVLGLADPPKLWPGTSLLAQKGRRGVDRGDANASVRPRPPLTGTLSPTPPAPPPPTAHAVMNALAALLLATLATTLATPATAQKDCGTVVLNMQTACAKLQPVFFAAGLPSVPFAAATDCAVLSAGAAALLPEATLSPACCEAAREFAAVGCTCDADVETLLVGLGLLPRGAPAGDVVLGIIKLAQASACALDNRGGPILEACSGATGCGGPLST